MDEKTTNVLKFQTREEKEQRERIDKALKKATEDFNADCEELLKASPWEFKRLVAEKMSYLHEQIMLSMSIGYDQGELLLDCMAEKLRGQDESIDILKKVLILVAGEALPGLDLTTEIDVEPST